jgi:hypothetical protein
MMESSSHEVKGSDTEKGGNLYSLKQIVARATVVVLVIACVTAASYYGIAGGTQRTNSSSITVAARPERLYPPSSLCDQHEDDSLMDRSLFPEIMFDPTFSNAPGATFFYEGRNVTLPHVHCFAGTQVISYGAAVAANGNQSLWITRTCKCVNGFADFSFFPEAPDDDYLTSDLFYWYARYTEPFSVDSTIVCAAECPAWNTSTP